MRTQSISIDLSSITHNNIYNHYSDKKIENIFQNNKNILTLRDEEFYDKYPSKYNQRNIDNNENPMEINYSYKTILTTSKKSRSLSKRRDEKKKLHMIKLNGRNNNNSEEIKLKNIIKSLEIHKKNMEFYRVNERNSEPKKLIDRIRKIIKIKNHNY